MSAKIFIDYVNHPKAKTLVAGQRVTLTLSGRVEGVTQGGIMYVIDSMAVGKKNKLNPTEVMIASKLDNIEKKLPGQATTI